jgi:uncharacterized SAM-dependent methyltransferase
VGRGGGLLLGFDRKKDPQILHAAYNDRLGVTADFNLNILARINRELAGDFALDQFQHCACYNPRAGRIEIHLVSALSQRVRIGNEIIYFREGEPVRTEYSYKYSLADIRDLVEPAGFRIIRRWTDERRYFSVVYATVSSRNNGSILKESAEKAPVGSCHSPKQPPAFRH